MKKIVSLIASFAMICSFATSVFAYSSNVTGANLNADKVITYTEGNAFTFKFIGSEEVKGGSNIKVDLTELVNAGWEISAVDGAWSEAPASDITATFNNNLIQVKWTAGATYDVTDVALLQFVATPKEGAGVASFTIKPSMFILPSGQYKVNETFTLVKGASEDKTTATIGANGVVEFDYADADVADAKLAGKKVVLGTAYAGNLITADTTVKVTYTPVEGAAETKTFGETLFEKLDVEGFGFLATESITFGIVCDTAMTGTFSFALN